MLPTALIVFRESLEAALFVGIVAAATRGLPGRRRWLAGGVAAGLLGALALAGGAGRVAAWADGLGQDLVNVAVLAVALTMLAWHCVWVSSHGREMALQARTLGSSVLQGRHSPWALTVAVALAVLREGAETVLFVAGLAQSAGGGTGLLAGALLGLAAGVACGMAVYAGLARVRPQHLFAVTNGLILLLAASIASQLARALAQSGLVELWSTPLWDSTRLLDADSALGALLHAIVGYDARPSGLQLLFYVAALGLIALGTRRVREQQARPARPRGGLA